MHLLDQRAVMRRQAKGCVFRHPRRKGFDGMGVQCHLLFVRAQILKRIGAMFLAHQVNAKRNQAWRGAFLWWNSNCGPINIGQIGI